MIVKYIKMNKTAFTLMEMLVVVIIIATLATMAIPMYQRAIEKSYRAEVSVTLSHLCDAKMRAMTTMNILHFENSPFTSKHLDADFSKNTGNFRYSLYPEDYPNAVCAEREEGKYKGTTFMYFCGGTTDQCDCSKATIDEPCGVFCNNKNERFFCHGDGCDIYGVDDMDFGTCNDLF